MTVTGTDTDGWPIIGDPPTALADYQAIITRAKAGTLPGAWTLAPIALATRGSGTYGWKNLTDIGGATGAGINSGCRSHNGHVTILFRATSDGLSTGNPGGDPNIPGDPLVATITDSAYRPRGDIYAPCWRPGIGSGNARIAANGEIRLTDLNAIVGDGDVMQFEFNFWTA